MEKGGKGKVVGEADRKSGSEGGRERDRTGAKDAEVGQGGSTVRKTRAMSTGQGSLPGAWRTGARRVSSGGKETQGIKGGRSNCGGVKEKEDK